MLNPNRILDKTLVIALFIGLEFQPLVTGLIRRIVIVQ